jgi:hypothetical protein
VTEVPVQTGLEEDPIPKLAVRIGLTVITISLDVPGLPVGQIAFEVRTQLTLSLFTSAALIYVVLFVPTFVPLSFH